MEAKEKTIEELLDFSEHELAYSFYIDYRIASDAQGLKKISFEEYLNTVYEIQNGKVIAKTINQQK